MRMHSSLPALTGVLLLLIAGTMGCQGTGSRVAPAKLTRDANGFSIEETAWVGVGVRADFDAATRAIEEADLARGIELLEGVVERAPEFAAAHINLGIAYRRSDELEPARAALLRALEVNPRHPVAHNELGIVHRRSGDFAEARASYEAALDLEPNFHFARKNLAVLCDLYLSDPLCALENYRLYLEANPQDETAEIWIADLENRIGKGDE